jgi:hypothetical protein
MIFSEVWTEASSMRTIGILGSVCFVFFFFYCRQTFFQLSGLEVRKDAHIELWYLISLKVNLHMKRGILILFQKKKTQSCGECSLPMSWYKQTYLCNGYLLDQSNISKGCNFHQSVISIGRLFSLSLYQWMVNLSLKFIL